MTMAHGSEGISQRKGCGAADSFRGGTDFFGGAGARARADFFGAGRFAFRGFGFAADVLADFPFLRRFGCFFAANGPL
jgi:hypothetical protein